MDALLAKYKKAASKRSEQGPSKGTKRKDADDGDEGGVSTSNTNKSARRAYATSTSTSEAAKCKPDDGPPHYLILGAQKAGTMAAVVNLNKHPEVFCLKEPHFFDLGWHSKSVQSYRNLFSSSASKNKKIRGEKTPELIFVDACAPRIKQVCPSAKFVLIIRDPIKRAFSAWNMNRNRDIEQSPFDSCVNRNLANLREYRSHGTAEYQYVQRGFYLEQIKRWLEVFPDRDQLLIVVAERMRGETGAAEYNRIFKHIGASEVPEFVAEDEHVGTYGEGKNSGEMSTSMLQKLKRVYVL
jgi:hypothetical protein